MGRTHRLSCEIGRPSCNLRGGSSARASLGGQRHWRPWGQKHHGSAHPFMPTGLTEGGAGRLAQRQRGAGHAMGPRTHQDYVIPQPHAPPRAWVQAPPVRRLVHDPQHNSACMVHARGGRRGGEGAERAAAGPSASLHTALHCQRQRQRGPAAQTRHAAHAVPCPKGTPPACCTVPWLPAPQSRAASSPRLWAQPALTHWGSGSVGRRTAAPPGPWADAGRRRGPSSRSR